MWIGRYLALYFSRFDARNFKHDVFFASLQNKQAISASICEQFLSTPEAILYLLRVLPKFWS